MEYDEEILEKCLPKYLEEDLKNFKEGVKNKSRLLDCLLGELQQSINCAYVDNEITDCKIKNRNIIYTKNGDRND